MKKTWQRHGGANPVAVPGVPNGLKDVPKQQLFRHKC